jgi:hypothetical protein
MDMWACIQGASFNVLVDMLACIQRASFNVLMDMRAFSVSQATMSKMHVGVHSACLDLLL